MYAVRLQLVNNNLLSVFLAGLCDPTTGPVREVEGWWGSFVLGQVSIVVFQT